VAANDKKLIAALLAAFTSKLVYPANVKNYPMPQNGVCQSLPLNEKNLRGKCGKQVTLGHELGALQHYQSRSAALRTIALHHNFCAFWV
jgi:hypothetical protein